MSFDLAAYLAEATQVHEVHGHEHVVPCLCDSGTGKAHMWVNVKKCKAICYRCGLRHGDAVGIVGQVSDLDTVQAYRLVRQGDQDSGAWKQMHEALTEVTPMEDDDTEQVDIYLPDEFRLITSAADLPPYAVGRGIDLHTCHMHGIGVCQTGFYADRLVIPVWDTSVALKSFVARLMRKGGPAPKVLYPRGSRTARLLFNEPQSLAYDSIVVTEGVFDALRVGGAAVALFGKHASQTQIQRLVALGESRKILVMLDDDAIPEARGLCEALANQGCESWLVTMPSGRHDPGECSQEEIVAAIKSAKRVGSRTSRLIASMGLRTKALEPPRLTGGH